MCWRRLPVYKSTSSWLQFYPKVFFFFFLIVFCRVGVFHWLPAETVGVFSIGPSSLTSPQDSAWRNSSCFSVCLKKQKVYSDSKQEGEVLWPIFTLLSFILPKWPHRGTAGQESNKLCLTGDVFSIYSPASLFRLQLKPTEDTQRGNTVENPSYSTVWATSEWANFVISEASKFICSGNDQELGNVAQ